MEPDEFLARLASEILDESVDVEEIQRAQAANRAAEDRRLRAVSLSVDAAAERLGVTTAQVTEMIAHGALWACPDGAPWVSDFDGEARIPLWQFAGDGLIPHLDMVVAAIPPDWSPSAIEASMTHADEDFDGLSPTQWLIQGGDPVAVAAMLTALPYTY